MQQHGEESLHRLRGLQHQAVNSSASSFPITWPAGTISGDTAVLFCSHFNGWNTPSGWSVLDNPSGAFIGAGVYYKVLNGTDISNGGVTPTSTGSGGGYVAVATYAGTVTPTLINSVRRSANTTVQGVLGGVVTGGSQALYFMGNRGTVTSNTVNVGSQLQQGNDGSAMSGALYQQAYSVTNGSGPTFNFVNSAPSGYYIAIVQVH